MKTARKNRLKRLVLTDDRSTILHVRYETFDVDLGNVEGFVRVSNVPIFYHKDFRGIPFVEFTLN